MYFHPVLTHNRRTSSLRADLTSRRLCNSNIVAPREEILGGEDTPKLVLCASAQEGGARGNQG